MFYYNGVGVDIIFMGVGEMDLYGYVNVIWFGVFCFGVGGFIDIIQNVCYVVFCFFFIVKGLEIVCEYGVLYICCEGEVCKFVVGVNQIFYNGELVCVKG